MCCIEAREHEQEGFEDGDETRSLVLAGPM